MFEHDLIGKPVPTFPDHALDETFKLKLLGWRRRVLPPGLPAVHSEFQRHRLATGRLYAGLVGKDRLKWGWPLNRATVWSGRGESNPRWEPYKTFDARYSNLSQAIALSPTARRLSPSTLFGCTLSGIPFRHRTLDACLQRAFQRTAIACPAHIRTDAALLSKLCPCHRPHLTLSQSDF